MVHFMTQQTDEVMYNRFVFVFWLSGYLCLLFLRRCQITLQSVFLPSFFGVWGCQKCNILGKNGAIAERVAQCSQPGSEIAQSSHNLWVGRGDDKEICIHVQDDGPTSYQVVQVGASQTY